MAKRKPTPRNYVEDLNPFGLPRPPQWWLDYMFNFDPDMVMIPSRKRPVYNLCRRVRLSPGIGPLAIADAEGDLTVMKRLDLVPSAVIIPATNGTWTTNVFDLDLANRDIWSHGGPDAFADKLESKEKEAEEKQDKAIFSESVARRRDMARSFQARTGQRSKLPDRKPRKREQVLGKQQEQARHPARHPQSAPTPPTGSRILLA